MDFSVFLSDLERENFQTFATHLNGDSLYLTIDSRLQKYAEELIAGKKGSIIAIKEPKLDNKDKTTAIIITGRYILFNIFKLFLGNI